MRLCELSSLKFITRHQEELTGEFFEELTRGLLKQLKSGVTDVAGDGTVIEAMSSRYRLLQEEALREEAQNPTNVPSETTSSRLVLPTQRPES